MTNILHDLAGLAIMKIGSWDESTERRGKDAADRFIIMKKFIEAGHMERFFEEEGDILRKSGSVFGLVLFIAWPVF